MDAETRRRVRNFQARHKLKVTGVIDKKTWKKLRTGQKWTIDNYTMQPKVKPTQRHSSVSRR